jgi:glycosyltransferase involved in cell wall biosynthesis
MSRKILQIMYSDYAKEHTMGIRLFYINEYNDFDYTTICRSSIINNKNIITTSKFTLFIGKALSVLVKKSKLFRPFKGFDLYLFKKQIKQYITNDIDAIHLFNAYPDIIEYAHSIGFKVIVEAFTHPLYLEMMYKNGIKFDREYYTPDKNEIEYYKQADVIISPSSFVTKTLNYAKIDTQKIIEIPYGVNVQKDKIFSKNNLIFLFAGGVKRTKGFVELIDSWVGSGMSDKLDCKLIICGRVYTSNIYEKYNQAKNIQNIEFKGFVSDMTSIYQQSDVYIFPTYHEGSSKTVFEAMSYGLPVITTENAGSIVRDGFDGFMVPVNNVDSLVEKIKYFYKNREQIEILGKNVQKYSREFTWKRYSDEVNKIYEKVLNNEN